MKTRRENTNKIEKATFQFWLLLGFLVLVFFTGGSSRIDTQSLIILRPASIIVCALALATIKYGHFARNKWLLIGFVVIIALVASHIVPLPPALWRSISGRSELADIADMAGLHSVWRPLSLTPMNSWHSLLSLTTPLAVILLGIQLTDRDLRRLLTVLIALTLVSALFGLLQLIGDPNGPLYLYRITNNGSAVGLFANRNHAATLLACVFPLLVAFTLIRPNSSNEKRFRQILAISVATVLIPLILITGSRAGVLVSLISIAGSIAIYYNSKGIGKLSSPKISRELKFKRFAFPVIILAVLGILSYLAYAFSRAEAIDRLFSSGIDDQTRTDAWNLSISLFWKYFPFGSGAGSFVETFQIVEPNAFLSPNYLNRAHNDFAETAVTFGVPGIILIIAMFGAFLIAAKRIWVNRKKESDVNVMAQASLVIMVLMAISSFFDYPLRTSTMLCVLAINLIWIYRATRSDKGQIT